MKFSEWNLLTEIFQLKILAPWAALEVKLSVWQYTFVKKWPLQYQMVTLTYLHIYLCESTDSSDQTNFVIFFFLPSQNCDKTKKNPNVKKPKNSNWDKTQNSDCDKTQKIKFWQNLRTKIVTTQKLKLWKNLKNLNLTKLKRWQNSKSQMVKKIQNSNCQEAQKTNFEKKTWKLKLWWTQILKLGQNPKTQIVTKLKKI